MIVDSLENIDFYEAMLPNLKAGLKAIEEEKSKGELKEGTYYFEGGFFKVQKGVTIPFEEGTFEGHVKNIDVQIMLEGSEEIAWKDIKELKEAVPYDEEMDMVRYKGSFEHRIMINKGMFWVAFPQDGHKSISHSKEQHSFTKIILKLPVK